MTRLRSRWVVLVAALAGVALTASLGAWQLRRGESKLALQRAIEERAALAPIDVAQLARTPAQAVAQHHRGVLLQGRWAADRTVYLDNRQMDGRPGFFVVTPLRLDGGSDAVLVQRGWIPRNTQDRAALAPVSTPDGPVVLRGRIAPPPARLYEFESSATGSIRQNLDVDTFARETGLALRPLSVLQTDADGDGDALARRWPQPAVDVHKHWGYAFQWFALAALITLLYAWFQLVRPRIARRRRA